LNIPISIDIPMTKEHLVLLHRLSLLLPQVICVVVNDDSHVSLDTLATVVIVPTKSFLKIDSITCNKDP
jgi:hypothetical protein